MRNTYLLDNLNVRENWKMILPVAFLFLLMFGWFVYTLIQAEIELRALQKRELHGIIVSREKVTKGCYIKVKLSNNDTVEKYYFQLLHSWFEENNIQSGDSISKQAGSRLFSFYKKSGGVWEWCCNKSID